MMLGRHILSGIPLVVVLVVATSCCSLNEDARYREWVLSEFNRSASHAKHVVLVCIYGNHFQRKPQGYHRLDQEGIVVRSYKGDWKVGEKVTINKLLETAPASEWTPQIGYLQFLLLEEHTSDSILVNVGEDWDYSPEFEQVLEFRFPRSWRK